MANYYESEALGNVIKAVDKYQKELEENFKLLVNAANVCDMAMGSDALSAIHIARLHEALAYLEKTNEIAQIVLKDLIDDKRMADEVK